MIAWQIDVHHGDGVEEAFCYSSSVLTISFHHFAPVFFPGSGALIDQAGAGAKECIINVPLLEGCSDAETLIVLLAVSEAPPDPLTV